MTALPSMPLFVDDYEAAAAHLTLEEDGAYNRLLRLCWRMPDCSVPDDAAWIARYLRIDAATFDRLVAPLIDEFFSRAEGRVFQKRQVREFQYVTDLVAKRRLAGKRGGEAKARKQRSAAGKAPSKATGKTLAEDRQRADVGLTPTSTPIPIPIPIPTTPPPDQGVGVTAMASPPPKRGKRLPATWQPSPTDRDFAAKEGLTDAEIDRTADRFRDYWAAKAGPGAVKRDWAATWRNWVRTDGDRRREEGTPGPNSAPYRPGGGGRAVGGGNGSAERSRPGSVTEAAFRVLAGLRDDPDLSR